MFHLRRGDTILGTSRNFDALLEQLFRHAIVDVYARAPLVLEDDGVPVVTVTRQGDTHHVLWRFEELAFATTMRLQAFEREMD